jgi:glycosyltransferase involved in cell wall biosynthesis
MDTLNPTSPARRRFAFVVPRFGECIAGGAETLVALLAQRLARRGDHVEVFTTCARDNRTWANEFPPGDAEEFGLSVKRFPVDPRDLERWVPHQMKISAGQFISVEEQLDWMSHGVNSLGLYAHLHSVGREYDALFFAPYLFATSFWGSRIHPDRSYLIPCLHDEAYAYLPVVQSMFRGVAGAIFNAAPECELARALYGDIKGGEVGMGFEPFDEEYVEGLTPYFGERFPYIVYLGRKETGKNVHQLIDYFIAAKERGAVDPRLRLVVAGAGAFEDLHRPEAGKRSDIIDIGHVTERDKHRLVRHSLALCQPSCNESFSIVIMEAWLLGTPVLVHAQCAVTRYHAVSAGGGLFFATFDEFASVVAELAESGPLRVALAQAGGRYVRSMYAWSTVLERFDAVMNELLQARQEVGVRGYEHER